MTLSLPSLQYPSLWDWQISPGSFAATPQTLIGADGCETLIPSNLIAIETLPLRQIQRIIGSSGLEPVSAEYPIALIVEYMVEVVPIGHSLGQILYSLPLAPGESVSLAVLDWRRNDSGTRGKATKLDEGLVHDQARDRTITELLSGAIDEWQRGGSVVGGISGGGGASASMGAMGASGGDMASLGGAYTTSSGTRDISVSTMQKVVDKVHQASNALRALTSTVVVNTDQQEKQAVETRSFANNNRGHTMTILYYEILRHFLVTIKFNGVCEGLLIDRDKFSWRKKQEPIPREPPEGPRPPLWSFTNNSFLIAKRHILQPALLDTTLNPAAFDALVRLQVHSRQAWINRPPPPQWAGELRFSSFSVHVGIAEDSESQNTIFLKIKYFDGRLEQLSWTVNPEGVGPFLTNINDTNMGLRFGKKESHLRRRSHLRIRSQPFVPGSGRKWGDLHQFNFAVADGDRLASWNFLEIVGIVEGGVPITLFGPTQGTWKMEKKLDEQSVDIIRPPDVPPPPPPDKSPEQSLSPEEYNLTETLKDHLSVEQEYYNRVLDLSIQPQTYAAEFEGLPLEVPPGGNLLDHASPTPLELFGNKIAFPRIRSEASDRNKIAIKQLFQPQLQAEQRLITIPTRGVFAEAKLGHCNVAEEIDGTQFWQWDEHPLPENAPEIAPVQTVTPENNPPGLAPTSFPAPIVNIQEPPAAPDPPVPQPFSGP
ncbi:uncharacterized protein BKA55DRAFT_581055 [Fusarium redolens]|uniref:Uncharacterized protein n=1 Tax=Fusarium redolens TaxID=48865 RepID=A0A9P9G6X6_FUSRE|nr:uncharacterized protein BKA55DRAFT_581055 [Fusarium redolens]KAH7232389.1 hypothetical protein BKA55DRAFT_581055 [Fusarium redolens]